MDPATPYAQRLQAWHAFGLGFTPFAHHYLGHLLRFLFLRLLRCFTSPGCRPRKGRMDCSMQVSPFRYPRITGCLLLPAAFRSWLRLSSASGAKAFPACPLYLNLINPLLTYLPNLHAVIRFFAVTLSLHFQNVCASLVMAQSGRFVIVRDVE